MTESSCKKFEIFAPFPWLYLETGLDQLGEAVEALLPGEGDWLSRALLDQHLQTGHPGGVQRAPQTRHPGARHPQDRPERKRHGGLYQDAAHDRYQVSFGNVSKSVTCNTAVEELNISMCLVKYL